MPKTVRPSGRDRRGAAGRIPTVGRDVRSLAMVSERLLGGWATDVDCVIHQRRWCWLPGERGEASLLECTEGLPASAYSALHTLCPKFHLGLRCVVHLFRSAGRGCCMAGVRNGSWTRIAGGWTTSMGLGRSGVVWTQHKVLVLGA